VAITTSASDARHPDGEYSRGAKWFHWVTAPALGISLLSGVTIRFITDDAKMSFYTLHESLGLLIFALSISRLLWRLNHQPPPSRVDMPLVSRVGVRYVHPLLYGLLIVQPMLGFFTTNAYGFPQQGATAFLGFIDLPKFMEAAPDLARALHWVHSIIGWSLAPLLAGHVGGVLYHHIVRRDGTLLRML
jgi:cytochrome b561